MNTTKRNTKYDRPLHSLRLAKRFLLAAALVQLPLVLPIVFHIRAGGLVLFWSMTFTSGVLAILGYLITKRQVEQENLENPSPDVRLPFWSLRVAATVFFWVSFFLLLGNLILIVWNYVRANSAIQTLERWRTEEVSKQEQMGKLRGGVCDAFRSAP